MDLRWEIDFWGRIRRGREAAQAETNAIEEDARAVALSLISDVGQSYFRIRELDEQLDIAGRTLAVRQESSRSSRSAQRWDWPQNLMSNGPRCSSQKQQALSRT